MTKTLAYCHGCRRVEHCYDAGPLFLRCTECGSLIARTLGRTSERITPDRYVQGMACMACGLAGFTPDDHFPQPPGLWDRPCPDCGRRMVWVTEPVAVPDQPTED